MTEQEAKEVVAEIEQALNNQQAPAVSIAQIEIHHAGVWANLQRAAGVNYTITSNGVTIFGIPAVLGQKASQPFTIHFRA